MTRNTEKEKALAPEQCGSHWRHKATDLALNKMLTYNILHQLKHPGAVCSNDVKSCYDLICHTQASLAMQRMGVPRSTADCMFSMLQQAVHQVRTGYGDSELTVVDPHAWHRSREPCRPCYLGGCEHPMIGYPT